MIDQMDPNQHEDLDEGVKTGNRRRSTTKCTAVIDVVNDQIPTEQDPIRPDPNVAQKADETRKGKMWANEEIMVFYEAVKQLGKDFDGIVKIMQKKKVYKDKHQVRNFFFNCAKFLRNLCDINVDEVFPNVCRDAKELFFVVNSCEWRKRTGGSKYQVERMKELILDGTTTIKANKKNMVLKTPICPALQRYFTEFRIAQPDKVSDLALTLSLTPATYLDKSFVLSCEQNPVLNLKLSLNDRLSRVFEFLKIKWKQAAPGGNKLTLFPGKETEVGRVLLTNADPYGDIVSLNKLKREQEGIKLRSTEKNSKTAQNTVVTYTAVVSRPLTIDDRAILGGLTEDNVGEASVAELYCLCGLSTHIKMVYSIQSGRRVAETWRLFQELINREYGEQLASTSREEDPPAPAPASLGVVNPLAVKKGRARPAPPATDPPAKRLLEGSSIEQDDMALFKRQLKNSNINVKLSAGRRPEGKRTAQSALKRGVCEPTDFSQLMAEGFSAEPATDSRRDTKWQEREADKATLLSEGTLHSDSIQKYVHVTMNDVLQQDSNQVIGTMAELLNTIEDTL